MIQKFNADELKEQNARLVLEYERLFDEYEQAVKTILNLTHDNRVMHEVDCKRNKEV
jgi:hypothetical protein